MPQIPPHYFGMLLALASAGIAAIALTPYKMATQQLDTSAVVLLLLFFAASYNTVISLPELISVRHARQSRGSLKTTVLVATVCGVITALGNYAVGQTITLLNSAVTSLLIQTQVLFTTVVAWLWLNERVGRGFIVGALIAIAGVAVMRGLDGAVNNAITGTLWGLLAAVSFGMIQVIIRRYVANLRPLLLNMIRLWLAVLLLALIPGTLSIAVNASSSVMLLVALSAFGGPFLGRIALIYSARYIPAALSTLMGLGGPVFALVTEWLLLNSLPSAYEVKGGLIVMLGMALAVGLSMQSLTIDKAAADKR